MTCGALALDVYGYSQTSPVVADRRVDNTAPSAAMSDPGTPLTGPRTMNASSTDAGSGVQDVLIEYRSSPSGSWTTLCTDASAPYSCAWGTAGVADGLYDLRSTATDNAGNSATSAVVSERRVDNTAPTVTVTDPGAVVRGTITLRSSTGDGNGSGVTTVRYEYRASGTSGAWLTACTGPTTPFSCSFNTTAATDGLYDVRATATDGAALSTVSSPVTSWRIDNTIPSTSTFNSPGTTLSGTVTLSGSGTDSGSGIAALRFEYRVATTGTWTTACTDSVAPFASCTWASTAIADGTYDLRMVAVDAAGNERASTVRTNRIVDNNGPTTVLADPGTHLRATTTLSATATDVSGVQSLAVQYAPAGSGTWTTICTDTSTPYSCAWNTTGVANGAYDLRALGTDTDGRQSASTVLAGRIVDNSSPAAVDVQVTRAGAADRIDTDAVVFTYSQSMLPASILTGWNGASTAITVRVTDKARGGPGVDALDGGDERRRHRLPADRRDGVRVAGGRGLLAMPRPRGRSSGRSAVLATNALLAIGVLGIAVAERSASEVPQLELTGGDGSLTLLNSKEGAAIFNAGAMRPGQPSSGTVSLTNTGSVAGALRVARTAGAADVPGPGGGRLSDRLELRVVDVTAAQPATVYSGRLDAMPPVALGTLAPGARRSFRFESTLPAAGAADNAYQGAQLAAGFTWTAVGSEPPDPDPTPTPTPPDPTPPAPAPPAATPQPPAIAPTPVPPGSGGVDADPTGTVLGAKVFAMPSAKRCVSRRKLVIHVRRPKGIVFKSLAITVNRRTKVKLTGLKARKLKAKLSLRGLPKGRVVVMKVVAVTTTGRKAVSTRRYRTCAAKRG